MSVETIAKSSNCNLHQFHIASLEGSRGRHYCPHQVWRDAAYVSGANLGSELWGCWTPSVPGWLKSLNVLLMPKKAIIFGCAKIQMDNSYTPRDDVTHFAQCSLVAGIYLSFICFSYGPCTNSGTFPVLKWDDLFGMTQRCLFVSLSRKDNKCTGVTARVTLHHTAVRSNL